MSRSLKKGPYINERLLKKILNAKPAREDWSIFPEPKFNLFKSLKEIPKKFFDTLKFKKNWESNPNYKVDKNENQLDSN